MIMHTEKSINHSKRDHALLSASGAHRWLNCTPSAVLEDKYGTTVSQSTSFAEEGTLAHELSELYIRHDVLESIDDQAFSDEIDNIMNNPLFSEEMLDYVPVYVDYCLEELQEAKASGSMAVMEIEQKLDLTEFVPESFGTADCIIISDGVMQIIDLKYGKGIPVYAEWNKQEMLYALGALRKYDTLFDIEQVKLTIVQPRLNNISTWCISVHDLLDWANNELKPKAALAFSGEGELQAGNWCQFCAVKNRCRALYEQQIEVAKYEFKEPSLLTDDILRRTPKLVEWANAVSDYALQSSIRDGKTWPGFKLVEGISRRKWVDDDKVSEAIFSRIPDATEDQVFDMKLKTITQIEKQFGKKTVENILSDVIVKPQGKPTLVTLDDKRPALSIEDAKIDFS